jgi:hypothetical protein
MAALTKRNQWTPAQDNYLESLIEDSDGNWAAIAKKFNAKFTKIKRTGKMWRERWHNYLNPDITTKKITPSEEVRIFQLYKRFGNKWVEIAKNLKGRTENWVKNLYYATLRRYVRNINKFKTVQQDIDWLKDQDITEKMLAELFLVEDINFEDFQCIDSPEFKLLSKKVGKCRRRKDNHLVEYLLGERSREVRRKSKEVTHENLTQENIETWDKIK